MIRTFNEQPAENWERAWRVTERLLRAMRGRSEAVGAESLVVYAPSSAEIYPGDWDHLRKRYGPEGVNLSLDYPSQRMREIPARQGLAYLDVSPAFRQAASGGPPLYFAQDRHWTAAGNDLAARTVAEGLAARQLLTNQPPQP